ncbi:MAG TPA: hypothetical protein VHE34_03020 [Puia sp.]|jgi:hypothetical protein|uniref:hypothetical protein n=1 Tax=Puia sp. TaxID=2045100 RepID=UPI002BA038F9|nr:hypothetical protein [Puia sp.]HVU94162.1 hypothetical protein [Puia sp.]
MGHPKTPRTDALFGTFLQDIHSIKERHPNTFRKRYYRFDYAAGEEAGFSLSIEPDNFPKVVKKEIVQAFDRRLNQDLLPVIGQMKKDRKAIKP